MEATSTCKSSQTTLSSSGLAIETLKGGQTTLIQVETYRIDSDELDVSQMQHSAYDLKNFIDFFLRNFKMFKCIHHSIERDSIVDALCLEVTVGKIIELELVIWC